MPNRPIAPPSSSETVLAKRVIRSQDRAGFIVNALLVPYLLSAIRMLESGFATAEDIDTGMVEGCAHPMGPLALTDLIGLDTTFAVAESLYEEFREQLYAPLRCSAGCAMPDCSAARPDAASTTTAAEVGALDRGHTVHHGIHPPIHLLMNPALAPIGA